MMRRAVLFAWVPVLLAVGLASAQESYPIAAPIASKLFDCSMIP